jgi:hypothetical protein
VDGPTGLRRRRVGLNQAQEKSLRAKNWAAIDVANLAEEIERRPRKPTRWKATSCCGACIEEAHPAGRR